MADRSGARQIVPWSVPLDKFFDGAIDEIETDLKDGARVAAQALNQYTPVDTGRLVGNWQAGLNNEPPEIRLPDDPSRSFTIVYLEAAIEKFRLGDVLSFVNYTPYGVFVNDGTVKIEPRRFVERAAEDTANYFA